MKREAKKSDETIKQPNPAGMKDSDKKTDKRKPKKGMTIRNDPQERPDS